MFAGCSEISECVIGKHVQHVGVIRSFYLLGGTRKVFHCLGGQKNCWVVVCYGGSIPRLTL